MKAIFIILTFLSLTKLYGQESRLNDYIIFSETGDTILLSGGAWTDTNGVSTTIWRILSRSDKTDTLKTLSHWDKISTSGYFHLDSISSDTLTKYHLTQQGRRVDLKDIQDFKIAFSETKTTKGKKDKWDKDNLIKHCIVDFDIHYKNNSILSITDLKTMYFSKAGEKINIDKVVELYGWKMINQETYLVAIRYNRTHIKKKGQSVRYYDVWKIL